MESVMMDESTIIERLKSLTLAEKNLDRVAGKELGRGSYGRVFTVKYCGQYFAAKEIHSILLRSNGNRIREYFLRECYHCFTLRHPNIVQFIGVYWPPNSTKADLPMIVMELMDCNLQGFVETQPGADIMLKYSILHDVTVGLSFLHAQTPSIIHRDLTPGNILLTNKGVAKIGDLGLSKAIQTTDGNVKLTMIPGTADFMPPEAFYDKPVYDTSLDVFSFGGIVLFMITEQWPAPTAPTEVDPKTHYVVGFTEIQRRRRYLNKLNGCHQGLQQLVENCLDNDPKRRPAISAVSERIKTFQVCTNIIIIFCSYHMFVARQKCGIL